MENISQFSLLSADFGIRLLIDLITIVILIRFLYHPAYKNKDFVFSYILFNFVVFIITFFLHTVEISMGLTFGLFAIFSMLRYRTESISIKEMTYLFLTIATAMLCAVVKISYLNLGLVNFSIIFATWFVDSEFFLKREIRKTVLYEKIDLIKPENEELLLKDLENRTGIEINRFYVQRIDFLRDVAIIKIYYYDKQNGNTSRQLKENQPAENE